MAWIDASPSPVGVGRLKFRCGSRRNLYSANIDDSVARGPCALSQPHASKCAVIPRIVRAFDRRVHSEAAHGGQAAHGNGHMQSTATGVPSTMSTGERLARGAVVVFLLLAMVTLAFGLGMGVNELLDDDPVPVAPASQSTAPPSSTSPDSMGAQLLDEIYAILESRYVNRDLIDPEALRDAAIQGVINSLNDQHTTYLTQSEIESGALDLSSSYEGIGATVTDRNGVIQIGFPFTGSPAEQAGIRRGDIILEVDGESTEGWTDRDAVNRIRGPRGTTVTLKVRHTDLGNGAEGPEVEEISIVRGEIDIESVFTTPLFEAIPGVSGEVLVDRDGNEVADLAYINIQQFHDKTLSELRRKLEEVRDGNYSGLILDLRLNPGGLLSATVDVADEFLDGGVILTEVDATGNRRAFTASRGGLATDIPIVVLMDRGSASGAEVLAAALGQNGRATLVGQRTFGKGTVNQLMPLTACGDPQGCGALYVAVANWFGPNDRPIEGVGVQPDVVVELTDEIYEAEGDIQLFTAIEILRGQ